MERVYYQVISVLARNLLVDGAIIDQAAVVCGVGDRAVKKIIRREGLSLRKGKPPSPNDDANYVGFLGRYFNLPFETVYPDIGFGAVRELCEECGLRFKEGIDAILYAPSPDVCRWGKEDILQTVREEIVDGYEYLLDTLSRHRDPGLLSLRAGVVLSVLRMLNPLYMVGRTVKIGREIERVIKNGEDNKALMKTLTTIKQYETYRILGVRDYGDYMVFLEDLYGDYVRKLYKEVRSDEKPIQSMARLEGKESRS